jgi:hypothetical protein
MLKILLVLAAIGALVLSARLTYARPDRAFARQGQAVGLAMSDISRELNLVPGLSADQAQRPLLASAGESDRPAAALLVYLAFILISSVVGVALTRRVQRQL